MTVARVAHQFDDAAQQTHADRFGMWLFLATEALVFAVLFTGYTASRAAYPESFAQAGEHLYKWIGVGNAAILLLSSGAMALGVEYAEASPRVAGRWFLLTVLLGGAFLCVKAVEYALDVRGSILPLVGFDPSRFNEPAHAALFLVYYWVMTGLHALHVIVGLGLVSSLIVVVRRGQPPASQTSATRFANRAKVIGLYWHFVDIVWLFLLPLLYLNP